MPCVIHIYMDIYNGSINQRDILWSVEGICSTYANTWHFKTETQKSNLKQFETEITSITI